MIQEIGKSIGLIGAGVGILVAFGVLYVAILRNILTCSRYNNSNNFLREVVDLAGSFASTAWERVSVFFFRNNINKFIAVFIVFFAFKFPFGFFVKVLNCPILIQYIGSGISTCMVFYIGSQLKGGSGDNLTLVRFFTIFFISLLLSLVIYPSLLMIFVYFPEILKFLGRLLVILLDIIESILPFSIAYADSPEPAEDSSKKGRDINNRSRSRSPTPTLHQRITASYRERSPIPRMPPMASRVARASTPTSSFVNTFSLPILSRPQDMNCVDSTDITDSSVLKTQAFEDGFKVSEHALAGRVSAGFLPTENLFDLPTTSHEYNHAHSWFVMCVEAGDFFSAKQLTYRTLLVSVIESTILSSEYYNQRGGNTYLAAQRLASFYFKQRYEADHYFLS